MQELAEELSSMRQELAAAREVAARASSTWDKFRKERDFHRMHHKRVAQEKNRLISDIKRLKVGVLAPAPAISVTGGRQALTAEHPCSCAGRAAVAAALRSFPSGTESHCVSVWQVHHHGRHSPGLPVRLHACVCSGPLCQV